MTSIKTTTTTITTVLAVAIMIKSVKGKHLYTRQLVLLAVVSSL